MNQQIDILKYDFDNDLIASVKQDGKLHVRIYSLNHQLLVLGRGSKPEVELDVDACQTDGVPIYQRRGGGCSVLLDPDNVIVSVATPAPGFGENPRYFDAISRWLIDGLGRIGIAGIQRRGISDLVSGDRKIGGSCIYRTKGLLYYTTTLLVRFNSASMERYLKHPPREPDYRGGRKHDDFLMALSELMSDLTPETLIGLLSDALSSTELSNLIEQNLAYKHQAVSS